MEVHMLVLAGAEPMDEGDCANVQGCLVYLCRTGTVRLQALHDDPQEDAQPSRDKIAQIWAGLIDCAIAGGMENMDR